MICWKPNTTRVMLLDKLMYCHHDTFTGPETASTFLLTCYKVLFFSHAFCRFLQKENLKALPRTKIISKNRAISRYYSHTFVPLSLCSHCSSSHEIPSLFSTSLWISFQGLSYPLSCMKLTSPAHNYILHHL